MGYTDLSADLPIQRSLAVAVADLDAGVDEASDAAHQDSSRGPCRQSLQDVDAFPVGSELAGL